MIALLCAVRLASVILVQTYFVPDEYWQSLEISHNLVFGYGYKTWEWRQGIRSYFIPTLISLLYKLLHLCGLDSRHMLTLCPRLLQTALTCLGDVSLVATSRRLYGPRAAAETAWCLTSSWCLFYCGSRTLSNTVEMSLVSLALAVYPWSLPAGAGDLRYLWLGGVAASVRATSVLVWLPLWLVHLYRADRPCRLLLNTVLAGVVAVCSNVLLDSAFHGAPILTAYNFIRANVFLGVASHYGTTPWHAHFTANLPLMLGPLLLLLLLPSFGACLSRWTDWLFASIALFLLVAYSCLPHKEFRFLLPVLPFVLLLVGNSLNRLRVSKRRLYRIIKWSVWLFNLPLALYLGLVHQRGPLDIIDKLAQHLQSSSAHPSVLFLTPCHSTPLYSHLHVNVSARFLTCEPNLTGADNYTDEADVFYTDPVGWLRAEYPALWNPECSATSHQSPTCQQPTVVVLFSELWSRLSPVLAGRFSVCADVFHTHFPDDRRSERLFMLCAMR